MATWYIATTGNDTTGDGSSGNPWLTLAKAHTSASSGDTINVGAGSYAFVSLTWAKDIILVGAGASTTTFLATGAVVWTMGNYNWTISGIYFNSNGQSSRFIYSAGGATVTTSFTNCRFDLTTPGGTNSQVFYQENNTAGTRNTINFTSCVIIFRSTSAGYSMIGGRSYVTYNFQNCVLYTTDADLSYFVSTVGASIFVLILKNTILYNGSGGTITWNTGIIPGGTGTSTTYCDLYLITSAPAGTGNITSDPLFVDAASNNFNLRPSSPCIDTGSAS